MEYTINPDILARAEEILKKKEELETYICKCLKADMCPQCGEELVLVSSPYKPMMTTCSKDRKHYLQEFKDYKVRINN